MDPAIPVYSSVIYYYKEFQNILLLFCTVQIIIKIAISDISDMPNLYVQGSNGVQCFQEPRILMRISNLLWPLWLVHTVDPWIDRTPPQKGKQFFIVFWSLGVGSAPIGYDPRKETRMRYLEVPNSDCDPIQAENHFFRRWSGKTVFEATLCDGTNWNTPRTALGLGIGLVWGWHLIVLW